MFDKSRYIAIGCDHAGFSLKTYVMDALRRKGYHFQDFGCFSEESVDYPDIIHPLSRSINDGTYPFGLIFCGSGIGVSMVANKYPLVRAALCWDDEQARLSREHNDANVLSMAGRYLDKDKAVGMSEIFLNTAFEGGRHQRRVEKIPPPGV